MTVEVDPAPLTLIPEAITRTAKRDPDHLAFRMIGEEISYGELDRRSNSLANMLLDRGVSHGDRVGLYAHKSISLFVALHGIMKAGAAYVPINPDAPAAYVRHILEECEITHLVVGQTTRKPALALAEDVGLELLVGIETADDAVMVVPYDEVWRYSSAAPDVSVSGDDLAYIILTSGSTGRQKGIMHTHRSGLAYGEVAAATYGFHSGDRIANHPPLNFDLSLLELFAGIVVGATIVIIPEAHARLPASLVQMLEDEQVTVLNAVPFALAQMLHRGALEERDLSALRWILFGGEVFPTKDLRALMQRLPDTRFANVYGPAEVNGVTYYIVPEPPDDTHGPIPIGVLYEGMRALVVDEADNEVAAGAAGELLIHSPTHMIGYWRQPELSARSTYHRVDAAGMTERWHRTGDMVELGEDGLFRLRGRKDRMIKTRGHRVELDEIETVLTGHDGVEQAVVYAVPDGEGSQQVEAVVTLRGALDGSTESVEPTDLKRYAALFLPRYAVPELIRIVTSLPRTSTGKADRVALLDQAVHRSEEVTALQRHHSAVKQVDPVRKPWNGF